MAEKEMADFKDAAWFNFEIIQAFDNWLISQGGFICDYNEEEHGPTAVALNWIATVQAMLKNKEG